MSIIGFHPDLMCGLNRVREEKNTQTVIMYFPEYHCCDMGGAIIVAERFNPDVRNIQTYSGDRTDTFYQKVDNEWRSFPPLLWSRKDK